MPPIISSFPVPFWALLIAFAAAERFAVHVHFRRSAHSMSLGEIPFVFALVFAGGPQAILAGAIGRIVVLALHRKLPVIRLAFNFGVFLLGNCIAVLVFHAVAGASTEITPSVWAAAILATVANSLTAVLFISAAVSVSEGQLGIRQVARSLRTDLAVVVANTSVGLCAATIVYKDWKNAILMAIPVAGMFVSFRAYVIRAAAARARGVSLPGRTSAVPLVRYRACARGAVGRGARRLSGGGSRDRLLLAGRRRRTAHDGASERHRRASDRASNRRSRHSSGR